MIQRTQGQDSWREHVVGRPTNLRPNLAPANTVPGMLGRVAQAYQAHQEPQDTVIDVDWDGPANKDADEGIAPAVIKMGNGTHKWVTTHDADGWPDGGSYQLVDDGDQAQ